MSATALIEAANGLPDGEAAELYVAWISSHPDRPETCAAWFNLGVLRMRLRDPGHAATAYQNALLLRPDLHEATVNLGLAREAMGDRAAALKVWRSALPGAAHRRYLHLHLGRMLEENGALEEASAELLASLLIDPDQPDTHQHFVHLRQKTAAWPVIMDMGRGLGAETLAANCGPLSALALFDDPARQRDANAAWIARKIPPAAERLAPRGGYAHDRIRIGYLSSDYCRHPVNYLISEVLELHDRAAFEVHGYCVSPDDGSAERARVIAAFDHFTRLGALDDEAAARRIRADEIDILVDLNGLTRGARLGILRWKPAPVQATYLGYIGPVPLPELDWMICDAVTVPEELTGSYAPPPLRLQGCYQANDGRPATPVAVSRAEEGLPEDAFVFCSFSHHYKITPEVFGAWLAILERAPNAVLWLVEDGPASKANLTRRWLERGLAPERLIFAPRVDPARYRARMALGDLFLDTSPYNAGTVASDALRAGLPILTVSGRAFAARMAQSLLTAMDLGDLVAEDLEAYVAKAVSLARDPVAQAALRRRTGGDRWAATLGNAALFTRRLEDAYRRIRL